MTRRGWWLFAAMSVISGPPTAVTVGGFVLVLFGCSLATRRVGLSSVVAAEL